MLHDIVNPGQAPLCVTIRNAGTRNISQLYLTAISHRRGHGQKPSTRHDGGSCPNTRHALLQARPTEGRQDGDVTVAFTTTRTPRRQIRFGRTSVPRRARRLKHCVHPKTGTTSVQRSDFEGRFVIAPRSWLKPRRFLLAPAVEEVARLRENHRDGRRRRSDATVNCTIACCGNVRDPLNQGSSSGFQVEKVPQVSPRPYNGLFTSSCRHGLGRTHMHVPQDRQPERAGSASAAGGGNIMTPWTSGKRQDRGVLTTHWPSH